MDRQGLGPDGAAPVGDAGSQPIEAGGRALLCRSCGHGVTDDGSRMTMAGKHRHTFVNPHGHVFEIGVFAAAPGVAGTGEPSNFFSWFPGYAWRIVVCGGCGVHLGWAFGDAPDFFGLVLDRLVDVEGPRTP